LPYVKLNVEIKPALIEWAIRRAGYPVPTFVEEHPNVGKWISGEKVPTVNQLESFSKLVHVPFGYLFLSKPPQEQLPIPFFRTGRHQNEPSLNVFDMVLILQQRQEWLTEYLSENGTDPLPFVGKFKTQHGYKAIVADIRRTLKLTEDWASNCDNADKALDYLTHKIEDAGIIVNFSSIVANNTHRAISVAECRGFVLVNGIAPFMFVNSADAKGAQLFTIVHELAHVWLGVSAGFDNTKMLPANDPTEILCDQVAAEFLVPETLFISAWAQTKDFFTIAKRFKVSQIVVARRALDLNFITKSAFFAFYNSYMAKFHAQKENQGGGGDFYLTQKKRLSLRFTAYVNQAVKENRLLYRDAYKITGLKGNTYDQFITKHLN
jgi:Zn-dependent peptidase ImmA (M78 family)